MTPLRAFSAVFIALFHLQLFSALSENNQSCTEIPLIFPSQEDPNIGNISEFVRRVNEDVDRVLEATPYIPKFRYTASELDFGIHGKVDDEWIQMIAKKCHYKKDKSFGILFLPIEMTDGKNKPEVVIDTFTNSTKRSSIAIISTVGISKSQFAELVLEGSIHLLEHQLSPALQRFERYSNTSSIIEKDAEGKQTLTGFARQTLVNFAKSPNSLKCPTIDTPEPKLKSKISTTSFPLPEYSFDSPETNNASYSVEFDKYRYQSFLLRLTSNTTTQSSIPSPTVSSTFSQTSISDVSPTTETYTKKSVQVTNRKPKNRPSPLSIVPWIVNVLLVVTSGVAFIAFVIYVFRPASWRTLIYGSPFYKYSKDDKRKKETHEMSSFLDGNTSEFSE